MHGSPAKRRGAVRRVGLLRRVQPAVRRRARRRLAPARRAAGGRARARRETGTLVQAYSYYKRSHCYNYLQKYILSIFHVFLSIYFI